MEKKKEGIKKTITLSFLIVMFAVAITGCAKRKVSSNVYKSCKKAVKIATDMLDSEISKEEAIEMYDDVNCEPKDDENDFSACDKMFWLNNQIILFDNNDSEIEETIDELKDVCGI